MGKRQAELSEQEPEPLKSGGRPVPKDGDEEMGDYEDEFEDEFESEDEIFEAGVDGRPDAEREAEQAEGAMDVDQSTFVPGRHRLNPGETLAPDLSTYEMLHTLESPWPCLSLDIIRDQLGDDRRSYPATLYAVAGTQAPGDRTKENQLMVMKLSSLSRQEHEGEEDSEDDESDDEQSDPVLESKTIPQKSCTNRIRAKQSLGSHPKTITASLLESGEVLLHDITQHLASFDTPGATVNPTANKPLHTIKSHRGIEGYAIDWSPLHNEGRLLTGDVSGKIFHTQLRDSGSWVTDGAPFAGHRETVEELQWSPSEKHVFASGGNDGTVKIWDARSKSRKPAVSMQVSTTDVNVLSWSRLTTHLLLSGHDDGSWSCWDLRQWKPGAGTGGSNSEKPSPVANFNFHKEQITCLEWHPTDDSIVLVASGDNTMSIWDLAVELDDEESKDTAGVQDWPPQLLFLHWMEQVKEGHWHPQIPGAVMATGGSGFGVFKTISV